MWHSPQFYFQAGLFSKTLFFFKVRFLSVVPHWYCWIVSRPSKITYVLPPKPHASFKVWTLCCLWDSWIRTAFLVSRLRLFCQTSNCCASFQSFCEELWTRVLCGRKYPSFQHQYHQPSSNSSAIKLWEDESSRRWEESIVPEISLKSKRVEEKKQEDHKESLNTGSKGKICLTRVTFLSCSTCVKQYYLYFKTWVVERNDNKVCHSFPKTGVGTGLLLSDSQKRLGKLRILP